MKIFLKLILLAFPLLMLFSWNIIFDPWGVFRNDIQDMVTEPNFHFLKIDFLLENPNKFDSYVFGSSVANNIDVKKIPGGRYYNMYYARGLPDLWLSDVQLLKKKGVSIKNVLIALA